MPFLHFQKWVQYPALLLLIALCFCLGQPVCLNPQCVTCADDQVTCIGCSPGTFVYIQNRCAWCADINGLGKCYSCNEDGTICQQCYKPFSLSNGTCVYTNEASETSCPTQKPYKAAPVGYKTIFTCVQQCRLFENPDSNNICRHCRLDENLSMCLECSPDASNVFTCVKCKKNYGLNSQNECEQCMSDCLSCDNDISACQACYQGYSYENSECKSYCGNLLVEKNSESCDFGGNTPYDGCTDSCQTETDFECKIVGAHSVCSYAKEIDMQIDEPVNIPEKDTDHRFSITVNVSIALTVYDSLTADNLTALFLLNSSSIEIQSVSWDKTQKQFAIELNYTGDIGGEHFSLTISPNEAISESFYKTPSSTDTFKVLRECPANCENCTEKLTVQCTKCNKGYKVLGNGQCGVDCGDSYIINQQCDQGLGTPYDGCTDSCQTETDFECKIVGAHSVCSYVKEIDMQIDEPVNIPEKDTDHRFSITVNVSIALTVYDSLTADNLTALFLLNSSSIEIQSVSWDKTQKQFAIELNYTGDIGGEHFSLTISPNEAISESFYKTPSSTDTFKVLRECPANCEICTEKLTVQCTKCNHYYEVHTDGQCLPICGDSYIINQQCDLGLGTPYDGCTDSCQTETDFECKIVGAHSVCSYAKALKISDVTLKHSLQSQQCQLLMKMKLQPPLYIFQEIHMNNLIGFEGDGLKVVSTEWDAKESQLLVRIDYNEQIINQSVGYQINPSVSLHDSFFATQESNDTFKVESQYLANLFYTQSQFGLITVIDCMCWGIVVIAGIGYIIGLPAKNLAGIEAVICIQFCWMARLWNSQHLPLHYFRVSPLKFSTMYNHPFDTLFMDPQMNFALFSGFSTKFFYSNFNVIFALMLVTGILSVVCKVRVVLQQRIMQKQSRKSNDQESDRVSTANAEGSVSGREQVQMNELQSNSAEQEDDDDLEMALNSKLLELIQPYEKSVQIFIYCSVTIFLSFVNSAIAFLTLGDLSSAISFICIAISMLSYIPLVYIFCTDPYLTGIFYTSFRFDKPLRQYHYAFLVILLALAVGLLALKQYNWAPLIPISILILETIILRPYGKCIDNLRFLFLTCVAAYAVSINVALRYAQLSLDVSIWMLLALLVLLLVLVLLSLIVMVRECYNQYQKRVRFQEEEEMMRKGKEETTGQIMRQIKTVVRTLKMTRKDLKGIMALMLENKEDVFRYYKAMNEKKSVFEDMQVTADNYCREMRNELLKQKKIQFESMRQAMKRPKFSYNKMSVFSKMKMDFENLYGECEEPYTSTLTQRKRRQEEISKKQQQLKAIEDRENRRKMSIRKFSRLPKKVQDKVILLIVHNDTYVKLASAVKRTQSYKEPVNEECMRAYDQIDLSRKRRKKSIDVSKD